MSKKNLIGILLKEIIVFVQYFITNQFRKQCISFFIRLCNENIEKLSTDEDKARNSLLLIDSSVNEKVNLWDQFDVSVEGKELSSLKNVRRNDRTPITNMLDDIVNRDFRIEELSNKREIFSNDVSKIKKIQV